MSVEGKIAIVTGGAEGLGKAFAKALLKKKAKVSIGDVNATKGEATRHEFEKAYGKRVTFHTVDVSSHDEMKAMFAKVKKAHGRIDIVVNNAGVGGETYPLWTKTVDTNVKGTISGTMLAVDAMRRDKGGHGGVIINIASMSGLVPMPFSPVYSATKVAIIGFSKSWAINPITASNGVRINVLCPSFVDTAMFRNINNDNCLSVSSVKALTEQFGVMTTDYVAEGLMELIEDQSKRGAILKMRKQEGKEYV